MTRQPMAAREWIERATALLNRDPAATAARLAILPAALDRAAAVLPMTPPDPADAAELAARLDRIERAVRAWRALSRHDDLAECLESTRPAIEAAERLLRAAGRTTDRT